MDNFILIISYMAIGLLLKGTGRLPKDFANILNLYVIYVSLPALVLRKVPHLHIDSDLLFVMALPWSMLLLSAGLVMLIAKALAWPRRLTGCLLLMATLGNTSFLGIPMIRAFFGENAISYAIIYDQIGSFLALSTYGSIILALFGSSDEYYPSPKQVILKVVTFPPFVSLLLAFMLKGMDFPPIVNKLLDNLGSTLIPLVMIAVGFQLSLKLEKGAGAPLMTGILIKMVAAPICAILIAKIMDLKGLAIEVAIIEAGMPPMVSAGALAILANLAPRLTATLVGLGIFISFATLPALSKLIGILL